MTYMYYNCIILHHSMVSCNHQQPLPGPQRQLPLGGRAAAARRHGASGAPLPGPPGPGPDELWSTSGVALLLAPPRPAPEQLRVHGSEGGGGSQAAALQLQAAQR